MLVALVLTRPTLVLVGSLERGSFLRAAAGWMATITAAGLPPGIGFAARVLVLIGTFRVSGLLTTVVLAGLVIELVGPFRVAWVGMDSS